MSRTNVFLLAGCIGGAAVAQWSSVYDAVLAISSGGVLGLLFQPAMRFIRLLLLNRRETWPLVRSLFLRGHPALPIADIFGVVAGLVTSVFAARNMEGWLYQRHRTPSLVVPTAIILSLVAGLGAYLVVLRLMQRVRIPARLLAAVIALAASAGFIFVHTTFPFLWSLLGWSLPTYLIVTQVVAVALMKRFPSAAEHSTRSTSFVLILTCFGCLHWIMADPARSSATVRVRMPLSVLTRSLRSLVDFDGDGVSGLFGSDCNDFDAAAFPGSSRNSCSEPRAISSAQGLCMGEPASSVLLITVDAMRADSVFELMQQGKLPFLQSFQSRSTTFVRAYSTSSRTALSVASIFTGKLPSQIAFDAAGRSWPVPAPSEQMLAERLSARGVSTFAVPASSFFGEVMPLLRGFASVASFADFKPTRETLRRRIQEQAQIVNANQRNFIWVHLMDAHAPHQGVGTLAPVEPGARARYILDLIEADRSVATVVQTLEPHLGAAPLVIVSADHGEALGENGVYGHGHTLFSEDIRVPLWIRGPGFPAQTRTTITSLLDLSPVIRGALGERPEGTCETLSEHTNGNFAYADLLPLTTSMTDSQRAIVSDPQSVILDLNHREILVEGRSEGWRELYGILLGHLFP